jgi:hypothetical protein
VPKYFREVNKHFSCDKTLAVKYMGVARSLLGGLVEMSGDVFQNARKVILPDGTKITVSFAGSLAQIAIDVVSVASSTKRKIKPMFSMLFFTRDGDGVGPNSNLLTEPYLSMTPPFGTNAGILFEFPAGVGFEKKNEYPLNKMPRNNALGGWHWWTSQSDVTLSWGGTPVSGVASYAFSAADNIIFKDGDVLFRHDYKIICAASYGGKLVFITIRVISPDIYGANWGFEYRLNSVDLSADPQVVTIVSSTQVINTTTSATESFVIGILNLQTGDFSINGDTAKLWGFFCYAEVSVKTGTWFAENITGFFSVMDLPLRDTCIDATDELVGLSYMDNGYGFTNKRTGAVISYIGRTEFTTTSGTSDPFLETATYYDQPVAVSSRFKAALCVRGGYVYDDYGITGEFNYFVKFFDGREIPIFSLTPTNDELSAPLFWFTMISEDRFVVNLPYNYARDLSLLTPAPGVTMCGRGRAVHYDNGNWLTVPLDTYYPASDGDIFSAGGWLRPSMRTTGVGVINGVPANYQRAENSSV